MGRGVLKDYYQLYKYRLLTNIEELLTKPHNGVIHACLMLCIHICIMEQMMIIFSKIRFLKSQFFILNVHPNRALK